MVKRMSVCKIKSVTYELIFFLPLIVWNFYWYSVYCLWTITGTRHNQY